MLYPAGSLTEADSAFDRAFTYQYTKEFHSPEDQRIETETAGKTGKLLMFRDSFGNSLFPFMAESFSSARFSRAMPYPLTNLDGADTVLIEIVERNLDWLAERAPVFPAPERYLTGEPPEGEARLQAARIDDGAMGGYVRLEGCLEEAVDTASPIYIQIGGALYEASPAGDAVKGTPFTAYVPEGVSGGEVRALYFQEGRLLATAAAAL